MMADEMLEMDPRQEFANINKNMSIEELLSRIADLELQMQNMNTRNSHYRNWSPTRSRSASHNRLKKKFDPNGKFCYYHFKFGTKCFPEEQRAFQLEPVGKHEPAVESAQVLLQLKPITANIGTDVSLIPAELKLDKLCSYTRMQLNWKIN